MSDPMPIILCVKSSTMATECIDCFQPEYEVIHVIFSVAAGALDIPTLLRGETLSPSDPHNLGTRNYSKTPVAVILGRMYDDVDFAEMRESCKGRSNVPWLRQDLSKPEPPLGNGFAEAMVERMKACLSNLAVKGILKQDGVYLY
ncbi:hypothetical protein V499_07619 [Pseudogymnoascus sp. VKM F-103]|uniref:Uncharacterized protein n=1 Tax=Pseudogymnoascus verrucosus TaxID=342668 RepID=A0A2P2SWQ5_9PEZI|nr:uncharacterized protein VE01_00941 [Pseudogymnoascus verrucosus]KFY72232.1 hypothetical protein V499_07619 [Pseudogymnoascus sp. VKM F-103]OBT51849.1 hypothetical protein VE04_08009 [Pseudogymnoascus sp. 24MN13]OBU01240.1 hypothetical protein VE01_00941 [Pseudogymnoascus verrucosus]